MMISEATLRLAYSGIVSKPSTTTASIFTVVGGPVEIYRLIGIVTTAITNVGVDNSKLTANPAVGTSDDICANLDIGGEIAGTIFGVTGDFSQAMIVSPNEGALELAPTATNLGSFIVQEGTIDWTASAAETGAVAWYCLYRPVAPGAYVTIA